MKRELYQSATPAEAVADITASKAKYFTVLDAIERCHQCLLDDESQLLTKFKTHIVDSNTYVWVPYGIPSISEHYNHYMVEAFTGLSGFCRIVDNVVIYDNDKAQYVKYVGAFLQWYEHHFQPAFVKQKLLLLDSGYLQKVTKSIHPSQTPSTPTNCTDLCFVWPGKSALYV